MIKNFFEKKCSCVIGCIVDNDIDNVKKNFTVELKKNKDVKKVIEKPKRPITNLKGIGVYLFDKKIFRAINLYAKQNRNSDIGITEPIQNLIDAKKKSVLFIVCQERY